MPIYTCKKCGYAVHSKNIATRNSFPIADDTTEGRGAMMTLQVIQGSSYMKVVDDPQRPAGSKYFKSWDDREGTIRQEAAKDVEIKITIRDNETPAEAFAAWFAYMKDLPEKNLKQYICENFGRHDFEADGPSEV